VIGHYKNIAHNHLFDTGQENRFRNRSVAKLERTSREQDGKGQNDRAAVGIVQRASGDDPTGM
jgi:hypothetical protein